MPFNAQMFENAILALIMTIKSYNCYVSTVNITEAYTTLAQYQHIKQILENDGVKFEIETEPVEHPSFTAGKSFVFTKLMLAPEYAETCPVLKTMGFDINDTCVSYTFNKNGW